MDRSSCIVCAACTAVCPNGALEAVGSLMSADDVIAQVLKDRPFYRDDGGITLSGGEPFFQFDFLRAILELARARSLNTCVETSGYVSQTRILALTPLIDLFLFDYKLTDPDQHKLFTGVSNNRILSNLLAIASAGAKIILRCPVIPGINDTPEHFRGIGALANNLQGIIRIELMAYHSLGESKARNIGKHYSLTKLQSATDKDAEAWLKSVREFTDIPLKMG